MLNLIFQVLNIIKIFFNHLVNIPLNLLAGTGKFYAVIIAFLLDMLQVFIYTNILKGMKISEKFKSFIKIFPDEHTITENPNFAKFRKLQYLGIFLLASLPVYTGGICAAATLRHLSTNLNRTKSLIVLIFGSFTGCVIWVLGINYLLLAIKYLLTLILS